MRHALKRTLAPALALAFLLPWCLPQEVIVLKTGEQYECAIREIAGGRIKCRVADEEKTFALESLQRIDFQRERQFDGLDTADGLSSASDLFAEALSVKTEELEAKYPEAGLVILSDETAVEVGDEGRYAVERTQAWRILEQRGAESAIQSVYFFPGVQRADVLFGITVGPAGEVARISDIAIKDEAVYPAQPEYNYRHRLRFTLKNAVPGATLFLKTRLEGTATKRVPLVLGRTFWHEEPAVRQWVRLAGSDQALRNVAVVETGGLERADEGRFWAVSDTPQVFWESLMPPMSAFAPRLLLVYPRAEWAELPAVLCGGIEESEIPAEAIAAPSELYDRVRRDVRTVGVPQDALPAAPAAPAEVLERGYGTEVEKALLLGALLRAAGHEASTVLVSSRDNGPLLESAPRLRGFDAAVVRLREEDGSATWLQCDSIRRGFGELSSAVQGAKGLDLGSGEIIEIPARAPALEGSKRTVEVMLEEDGGALVKEHYRLTGSAAAGFRFIADLSAAETQKWAAGFVGSELPGVVVEDFSHSDFEQPSETETIDITYRAPALAQVSGDFLIMRLPNARYSPVEVGRSTRQWDLFWLGPESGEVRFAIRAPEGWLVYAAGEGAETAGDGWSLAAAFNAQDTPGEVRYRETWQRSGLEAPREDYQAYREALIRRGLLRNEMIVFHKTPGVEPGA